MPWDERQRRMLEAMNLRVWSPPASAAPAEDTAAVGAASEPAPSPRAPVAPAFPVASAVDAPTPPSPAPAPVRIAAKTLSTTSVDGGAPDEDSRRAVIARLDWTSLQQAVASCEACELSRSRRHTVFGTGHPQAHWMIVGEAPGEQEDLAGEPFVGPAGRLLDRMLEALGLSRQEPQDGPDPTRQVFIANTLKCRPPRNRNPAPGELAECMPYLERQIALVRPRIILAMGRFAVQALLGSTEALGRLRGRVHRYAGTPVIVTYHPAYLLRNLPDKAKAWEDLCLAAQVVEAAR